MTRWSALSAQTRQWVALGGGVALVAAVLSAFLLGNRAPAYQPLFLNLSSGQATRVEQELALRGIPFQAAGGAVTVPAADVAPERMAMAILGLPGSATNGLSSLSRLPFTATPTQQQAAMLAALQGEMAQAIDSLRGVAFAQVRLALAVPSPYTGQGTPATASVTLRLLPGVHLTHEQVQAIEHLVAYGVPGLNARKVVVVDQYGNLLSAGVGVTSAAGGLPGTLRAQQAYAQVLQGQINSLLAQVFGPGNALARVAVTLNMSSVHSDTTKYGPTSVPSSSSASKVTWKGAAPAIGGIAGATTNTPTYGVPVGAAGTNSSGTATQANTRFAVTHTVQNTSTPPGQVTGVTVAVAINGALTAAKTAQIKSLVLSTTGFAGTTVTVAGIPFRTLPGAPAPAKPRVPMRLLAIIGGGIAALLALWLVLRRRKKPEASAATEVPEENAREKRLRMVREAANEDVAAVVQTWLNEPARRPQGRN